jgi:hypothetical protein
MPAQVTLAVAWDADQVYQAAVAATKEKDNKGVAVHNDEELVIESKLATPLPDSNRDDSYLLKFATDRAQ